MSRQTFLVVGNSKQQVLSDEESKEYFKFLQESDLWFKNRYINHPTEFKTFAKQDKFKLLKSILGKDKEQCAKLAKNAAKDRLNFITKMKNNLFGVINHSNQRASKPQNSYMCWHQAFSIFLSIAVTQPLIKKQSFKKKFETYKN